MPNINTLLSDFEIVPSDAIPYISLDNQRRFYVNSSARRLMGVKPYQRLIIGYNPSENALAVIKDGTTLSDKARALAHTSRYNVDKRYYMSARYFVKKYAFDMRQAPFFFDYEHGTSDGTIFIFKLRE